MIWLNEYMSFSKYSGKTNFRDLLNLSNHSENGNGYFYFLEYCMQLFRSLCSDKNTGR